ncbi:MAG TPA: hypothetical protein VKZ57_02730 [Sphingobacterium sp.]|nr:hypothetical protein [Sphingobacterium sp.]
MGKSKDFLVQHRWLNLKTLAHEIYPTNKSAETYLSRKLRGVRPWTEKDEIKAKKALIRIAKKLEKL